MTRRTDVTLVPVLIAFLLSAFNYLHNNILIDFADEGFLWYGAQHVLNGKVPILDFQAYDPGRYYWCAAVMSVFGKGLMSLRLAAGLFQFLGLSLGLLALRRVVKSPLVLLGAGLLAIFFMMMPCRYFNASLPLIALFFAVRLIEDPSLRRHVEAGICTGLAAFIAINHGFYIFLAFSSLLLYLRVKGCVRCGRKSYFMYLAGVFVGSLPMLYFFVCVPGFWTTYWERLGTFLSLFGAGHLQGSLPIPWPWAVDWLQVGQSLPSFQAKVLECASLFSTGVLFMIVPVYYVIAVPAVVRHKNIQQPSRALFTAATFIGFVYLGHMFSRSDLIYLGEGLFPVAAGLVSASALAQPPLRRSIRIATTLFIAVSFFSLGLHSNIVFKTMAPKGGMTWYLVGKDRIWLTRPDAEYCENFKKLVAQYVKPEEPILLAPLLTTFYCLLEKECPVYELHFHIPLPPDLEERGIQRLEEKKVRWAVVANESIGGRPELAMSNSHPLLWRYLMERFEIVTSQGLRPGYFFLRRKD